MLTLTLKLMMTLTLTLTLSVSLLKLGSYRSIITSICTRICIAENFRYNVNGFVEELPQLPENRYGHSCAAIPSIGVRLIFFQSYQLLNPVQEYIVAGGYIGSYTDSVLSLLPGASSWTTLASLPRTVYQGRASVVGGNMRVAGGIGRNQVRIQ